MANTLRIKRRISGNAGAPAALALHLVKAKMSANRVMPTPPAAKPTSTTCAAG